MTSGKNNKSKVNIGEGQVMQILAVSQFFRSSEFLWYLVTRENMERQIKAKFSES